MAITSNDFFLISRSGVNYKIDGQDLIDQVKDNVIVDIDGEFVPLTGDSTIDGSIVITDDFYMGSSAGASKTHLFSNGDATFDGVVSVNSGRVTVVDNDNFAMVNKKYVEDYVAANSGSSFEFKGEVDVTAVYAGPTPTVGDIYVNNTPGAADNSWTGIGGDTVADKQQVIYTSGSTWILGGISDPSALPDATDIIAGKVSLADDINSDLDAASGKTAATPKAVKTVSEDSLKKSSGGHSQGSLQLGPDASTNNISLNPSGTADFVGNVTANADLTVGGVLTLAQDPVEDLQAATKAYVDANGGSGGGSSVNVNDNPPPDPTEGDMWWNSADGTLYLWYDDGNSSQWVVAVPTGDGGGGGGDAEVVIQEGVPAVNLYSPGALWWNNSEDDGSLYILYDDPDGNIWVQVTPSMGTVDTHVDKAGDTMTGKLTAPEFEGGVVKILDNPPAADDSYPGQLFWSNTEGRLYVYYSDDPSGSSQWVDASPTESGVTDSLVKRSGDQMLGPLKTGPAIGTVSGSLETNGRLFLGGDVDSSDVNIILDGTTGDATFKRSVYSEGGYNVQKFGTLFSGKNENGLEIVKLSSSGSAVFADNVEAAYFSGNQDSELSAVFRGRLGTPGAAAGGYTSTIYANGNVDLSGDIRLNGSNDQRIQLNNVGSGGNDSSFIRGDTSNVKFNAAPNGKYFFEVGGTSVAEIGDTGAATFASTVAAKDAVTVSSSSADNTFSNVNANGLICQNPSANSSSVFFRGRTSSGDNKVSIFTDGSAEFKSTVQCTPNGGGIYCYAIGAADTASGGLYMDTDASGALYLSPGSGQAAKVNLNGRDGSATFAGNVGAGNIVLSPQAAGNGIFIRPNGVNNDNNISLFESGSAVFKGEVNSARTNDGSLCFSGSNVSVTTSRIYANGDAFFNGTVSANGSVLTRASGTLDVGDRLEKADAALTSLKAAMAGATDFNSLKAALVAALTDI